MRTIVLIALLLSSLVSTAQIKGNKNLKTRTFNVGNIEVIKINLYAEVLIDCNLEETLVITSDENLFDYIDKRVTKGILHLNQLEWIQASNPIKITIGAPNLQLVETGTHETAHIKNVDNDRLKIISPIGSVMVQGKTQLLEINAKNGDIDASRLIAENANVKINGNSQSSVHVVNTLKIDLTEEARFRVANTPKQVLGDLNTVKRETNSEVQWISFKIKNNSWNRNKFVVVGPKKNGGRFSYGFAMLPGTSKKERWSVGTKVYSEKGPGVRELLVTIGPENENQTVKLFKK